MIATVQLSALRKLFIAELRSLVGTPYRHQGRVPGVGLDCVGLGVVAARAVGLEIKDQAVYQRLAEGNTLLDRLAENGDEIPVAEALPGDCLAIWFDRGSRVAQHVAFLVETAPSRRVVHAWADVGHVCECELGPMGSRVVAAFRIRGMD